MNPNNPRRALTPEQIIKADEWIREQDKKVARIQGKPYPNYGSCGGAFTYKFTGTSIGVIVKLSNCITGEKIDLSDYDQF